MNATTYYPCERPLLSGNVAGCVVRDGKITHFTETVQDAVNLAAELNAQPNNA